jgi:molybdate transport system substrate-binding protein
MTRTWFAALVTMLLLGVSGERPAQAAEITVRAGMGVVSSIRDLAPAFEKMTGHKVIVIFDPTPVMNEKINAGAPADIAAVQPAQVDELIKQGKMVAGTHTNFAQAGVGVAVKAGAPKPDISTVEAFKAAMLKAKSIGYSGGGSGTIAANVMAKLGIADQLKARTQLIDGRPVAEDVAKGLVEVGLQQIRDHSRRRRRLRRTAAEGAAGNRQIRRRRADGLEGTGSREGVSEVHRVAGSSTAHTQERDGAVELRAGARAPPPLAGEGWGGGNGRSSNAAADAPG